MMRINFLVVMFGLFATWCEAADVGSLDELVKQVRQDSILENQKLKERERIFLREHNRQAALLRELKAKLAREKDRGVSLKQQYEANEAVITAESERLHEQMGTLGELFGVVRQNAKDLASLLHGSLVSSQIPLRNEEVMKIADNKSNPTIKEMEGLWSIMLDEMVQTGKVARFEAPVITHNGEEQRKEVVRLGAFNAVSDGLYLRYLPETGRLVELNRQPPTRFTHLARHLQEATTGVMPVALDPSRGAILSLMVQTPSLIERVNQGGVIGYIIIFIGLIGLLLICERVFILTKTFRKMKQEQLNGADTKETPLTRIRRVALENQSIDSETLGLKLDQAILKERPMIKRFLSTIAIFAAIAPLLGLLGTVSGMIETFQSITLFGTGDPKLMSGGISVALITTELGLVVAIPLTLLHSWLSGSARKVLFLLDEESAVLVANREEHGYAVSG